MYVSHETREKLDIYQELLVKWNLKINLISPQTVQEIMVRHINDSLQLMEYIDNKNKTVIDLGTGAGLPGLVLAIAGSSNVHLIESDRRKTLFLQEVVRVLKLDDNVMIHNDRIENIRPLEADIVTSRACASLFDLLNYSYNHIKSDGYALFLKGESIHTELALATNYSYDYDLYNSVTDKQGVICKITNLRKKA